jgi:putative salt-induced outer membrane protein
MLSKKTLGLLAIGASSLCAAEAPWAQSFSLGLNVSKGNSDSTQFSTNYDGLRKFDKAELQLKAGIAFGEDKNKATNVKSKTTDNYFAEADFRRDIKNNFYWLINGSYKVDNVANLDYRINVGPGLGYRFINKPNTHLDTEAGLGYFGQKYNNTSKDDSLAYRVAEKWSHKLTEKSKVWQLAEILGDVSEGDNYVIKGEIGVSSALAGSLSLKSTVSDTYTNDPALGNKKNDITLMTMIVYSF